MIKYIVIVLVSMSCGCTTNIAWRGVVINTYQHATTEGKIANKPVNGGTSADSWVGLKSRISNYLQEQTI